MWLHLPITIHKTEHMIMLASHMTEHAIYDWTSHDWTCEIQYNISEQNVAVVITSYNCIVIGKGSPNDHMK